MEQRGCVEVPSGWSPRAVLLVPSGHKYRSGHASQGGIPTTQHTHFGQGQATSQGYRRNPHPDGRSGRPESAPPLSIRRAAEKYWVSRSTVQTRMKGVKKRAESQAKYQTLTPDEEEDIVRWIEKLDDMANTPRATRVIRMVEAILSRRPPNPAVKIAKNKQISKATLINSTYLNRL
jgi:hypothetical protein